MAYQPLACTNIVCVHSQILHNYAQLLFVWDVNSACPGHFLQIFEPLENVSFITTSAKSVLAPHALRVPNTRDQFYTTMFNYDVTELFPRRNYRHFFWLREIELRQRLIPTRHVLEKARKYVREHNICNASAMHIRRSDMWIVLKSYQRTSYDRYFEWVANRPPHEPVYLMTDNPKTQQLFLHKYGAHKLLVYQNMTDFDGLNADGTLGNATERRFSTLEHTMVDVLIAAHAKDFKNSPFSSMSDLVKWFKSLHRLEWCREPES